MNRDLFFFIRILHKFKMILTKKAWNKLPFVFILMSVTSVMEMLSVSLMLPFMELLMKPESIMNKWYIRVIFSIFINESVEKIIAVIALVIATIFIIKNIYIICELKVRQKFINQALFETQKRLLTSAVYRPYEYFMEISTSKVLTVVNSLSISAFSLLTSFLNVISESMTSGVLIITLFIMTPKISLLIALILLLLLLLISKGFKPMLKRASYDNQRSTEGMYKWMLQAIQGIKEVKVIKAEDFFVSNFEENGEVYVRANCKYAVLMNIPRSIIEAISMCAFFVTVAIHILHGNRLEYMIPIISVIAMAAIRMIPSINRISTAMANVAYTEPYLDELLDFLGRDKDYLRYSELSELGTSAHIHGISKELRVNEVSYKYPNSAPLIFDKVSLSIEKGEVIGIVGESGAGKSTLIDLMLGLLRPQSGDIEVDGISIRRDINGWLSQIGYIPQSIFMLDDSIRLNVGFGISEDEIDDGNVWKALDDAALGDFVRGLPDGLDTQIGERGMRLSGGQRQRIGIARALYRDPSILFFDEATSALDNDTEREIMESINSLKGKKTMVIIAHRLTTIESCDHVYRVEDGKMLFER